MLLLLGLSWAVWSRAYPAEAALTAGGWLLRAGAVRDADASFQRFLGLCGNGTESLAAVSQAYLAAGQWDSARLYLERVLRADPAHPARVSLGMAYEKLGRDRDAEQAYRDAVRRRPYDAYALNALGYFYAQRAQRPVDALALLHRALDLLPNEPSILDSLGWALYQQGDPDAALRQFLVAVQRLPSSGEVRLHLGVALAQRGMRDQALVELGKAVMLEPDLPGGREALDAVRSGKRPAMPLPYPTKQ